jgi:hypothetical protein
LVTASLALAGNPVAMERVADPGGFVVRVCEQAKALLEEALERGQIEQIAEVKSQAEAVRVYTVQRQLGRDAQLAAAEIVRRAERGIGVAIRRGQAAGQIRRRGEHGGARTAANGADNTISKPGPGDFASPVELRGNGAGIYHLTDGISDEDFEEAVVAARAEQDLSRANVVRKIRQRRSPAPPGPGGQVPGADSTSAVAGMASRDLIAHHAAAGMPSRQIGDRLGVGGHEVRQIAREHDIAIPADAVAGRTRRPEANRIVRETVHALEGLAMSVQLADPGDLDPAEAAEWAASFARSIRVLTQFLAQMRKAIP